MGQETRRHMAFATHGGLSLVSWFSGHVMVCHYPTGQPPLPRFCETGKDSVSCHPCKSRGTFYAHQYACARSRADFRPGWRDPEETLSWLTRNVHALPRRAATICARMASAISSGVRAPISRPIGPWICAICSSVTPASRSRRSRRSRVPRLPIAPT